MRTYAVETNQGTKYVCASTRQNAVKKLFYVREEAAIKMGLMTSIKICKED